LIERKQILLTLVLSIASLASSITFAGNEVISISSDTIDFGIVPVGNVGRVNTVLNNVSAHPLVVKLQTEENEVQIDEKARFNLLPGESRKVFFVFSPQKERVLKTEIKIISEFDSGEVFSNAIAVKSTTSKWLSFTNTQDIWSVAKHSQTIVAGSSGGVVEVDSNTGILEGVLLKTNSQLPGNFIIKTVNSGKDIWFATDEGVVKKSNGVDEWIVFNSENSPLPHNYVYDIEVGSDGTIWFATVAGLARKTSSEWTIFDHNNSSLNSSWITSLATDNSGNLWAGTYGGGVAKFDGMEWLVFDGLSIPSDYVWDVEVDEKGNVWIGALSDALGTGGGIAKYNGFFWAHYGGSNEKVENTDLLVNSVRAIAFDLEGNKWLAIENTLVSFDEGSSKVEAFELPNVEGEVRGEIKDVLVDEKGNKWCATNKGLYKFLVTNEWVFLPTNNTPMTSNNILSIEADSSDKIWIGSNGGAKYFGSLISFENQKWSVFHAGNSDIPNKRIMDIEINANDEKYLATLGGGLVIFDNEHWIPRNYENSNIPNMNLEAVELDDNDEMWVGSNYGGLLKYNEASLDFEIYNEQNSDIDASTILSLAFDSNGILWIGTYRRGLIRFDGQHVVQYTPNNSGLPNDTVYEIKIDSHQRKWIATSSGLVVLDGDNWIVYNTSNSGIPNDNVTDIVFDESTAWIGTDKGVANFDGKNWVTYTAKNSGLSNDRVQALTISSQLLWVGTQNGLSVFNVGSNQLQQ